MIYKKNTSNHGFTYQIFSFSIGASGIFPAINDWEKETFHLQSLLLLFLLFYLILIKIF